MTDAPERFDAIVIGSGFGGSVSAYRLAESGLRVCLLERGKPYPPGSFARTPGQMRTNFWDPTRGLYGLFDLWSFHGLNALVSSGLGGGSLIYANVLLRKDEHSLPAVKDVLAKIDELNEPGHLLPGVRIEPFYDRGDLVAITVNTVLHNMFFGIALIFLIQWVFLGDLRCALIVSATIPVASASVVCRVTSCPSACTAVTPRVPANCPGSPSRSRKRTMRPAPAAVFTSPGVPSAMT